MLVLDCYGAHFSQWSHFNQLLFSSEICFTEKEREEKSYTKQELHAGF